MTDEELNRWAAEFMEPQNPAWSPYANSPGKWWWWDSIDLRWEWDKHPTRSLDLAALIEAKVIETVGWHHYHKSLFKAIGEKIDAQPIITATARQRVMACYEAMREHNARTKGGKEEG